jgi:hypothetical protein
MSLLPDLSDPPPPKEPVRLTHLSAHDVLKETYQNADLPISTRLRAAIAAAPFELPKLAVVGNVNGNLGDQLEERLARQTAYAKERMKLPPPVTIDVPAPPVRPTSTPVEAQPFATFRRRV